MRKWFLWIIPVIIVSFCGIAILSGVFYIGFKDPRQNLSLHYDLCGDAIIDEHNKIEDINDDSIESTMKKRAEGLGRLANKIKSIKDYEKDPTCNYILAYSYFANKDIQAAADQYKKVKEFSDDFVRVNHRVKNIKNFDVIVNSINSESASDESKGE